MARRPENTRGQLVFQEGKCIEGEFYIIAAYLDPASCTITFAAYELENDCTYAYPLTFSEFDALFKFDSELMNPSNMDGRFHWVIQRLDFVQDNHGNKVLCLAQEPTPDEDEEDGFLEQERPKAPTIAPQMGGKVDAATRAKLLKELDTQDDHKLYVQLVKSEDARKTFISKLQSQRLLQVEKASQRLLKADEQREERLKKLDIIKRQQEEKAREAKDKEIKEKSKLAQLELLMKQKEAQAIRRLIQEKDDQDRGAGREKDAARQKRKMQERSAAEVRAIEAERAKQLGRKREDNVVKREVVVARASRKIADKIVEAREEKRAVDARRRILKETMLADQWKIRSSIRQEIDGHRSEFEAMEEVRERQGLNRDKLRAVKEREYWRELRERESIIAEERRRRLEAAHKEYHLQWKIALSNRAMAARERERRMVGRERRINQKEDLRLRRFRETQFLESRKTGMFTNTALGSTTKDGELAETGTAEDLIATGVAGNAAELAQFQKSFEQQERQRRAAERAEKRKSEDAKAAKITQLTGPDPTAKEMTRIKAWREIDAALKEKLMNAKLKRELENEQRIKNAIDVVGNRGDLWEHLEQKRRDNSRDRAAVRNQKCVDRHKNLPAGTALPRVLMY